jgi:hypothetical protein
MRTFGIAVDTAICLLDARDVLDILVHDPEDHVLSAGFGGSPAERTHNPVSGTPLLWLLEGTC